MDQTFSPLRRSIAPVSPSRTRPLLKVLRIKFEQLRSFNHFSLPLVNIYGVRVTRARVCAPTTGWPSFICCSCLLLCFVFGLCMLPLEKLHRMLIQKTL